MAMNGFTDTVISYERTRWLWSANNANVHFTI